MTAAERLTCLVEGNDPLLITRVKSGFVVISHTQFLPGYCMLLAYPQVATLNDLLPEARVQFLHDMTSLGDAVLRATDCARINYGIYGNLDRFLHAHIVPRYDHEGLPYCIMPPMNYPEEIREADEHRFNMQSHGRLMESLRHHLKEVHEHHHLPIIQPVHPSAHHP